MITLADAARAYASRGWFLFPLKPRAKEPATRHGFKSATSDVGQIDQWWTATPDANVGLHPGPSGLVVIDVDGAEGRAAATSLGLFAEPTLAVLTGREGGLHLYYRHPGFPVSNRGLAPHLDVRGDEGYVVLPPSIHPNGVRYRWDKAPLLDLPPDVVAALKNGSAPRAAARTSRVSIHEGTRNATLASLAGTMRRRGMEPQEIDAALQIVNVNRCQPPLDKDEVRRIAESVGRYPPAAPAAEDGDAGSGLDSDEPPRESEGKPTQPAARPVIVVREELVAVTDEALSAVQAWPEHGLYVRGNLLVRIVRTEEAARHSWLRRPIGAPTINTVKLAALLDRLDRAARWCKLGGKAGLRPAKPPAWVGEQILAREEWAFPWLTGIVESPTLRPDGRVLETPGYDQQTGLLYVPGTAYPPVPDLAGPLDTHPYLDALLDPLVDFPFPAGTDRAAYVAAVLTLRVRPAILGPVPLFPIVAPVRGAGKGLLAKIVALIGTGREPAFMAAPSDEAEWDKRLLVVAMDGLPVIVLDNVTGTLGSRNLSLALTATEYRGRLLGESRLVTAPLTAVWLATGNNLHYSETIGRRVVPINLDPQCENPEDRAGFRYPDVIARVRAMQPALVVAALAIVRAYILAGQPQHGNPRMGSYEAWDDLIRGCVVWCGLPDPAGTDEPTRARGRIRAELDQDLDVADGLLTALRTCFGDEPFTALMALKHADPLLQAAVTVAATPKRGGQPTAKSLGPVFRDLRDRRVRGRMLIAVQRPGQPGGWWMVKHVAPGEM